MRTKEQADRNPFPPAAPGEVFALPYIPPGHSLYVMGTGRQSFGPQLSREMESQRQRDTKTERQREMEREGCQARS